MPERGDRIGINSGTDDKTPPHCEGAFLFILFPVRPLHRSRKKKSMEKNNCNGNPATGMQNQNNKMTTADTRPGKAMRVPVVTQNMPENGVRITPAAPGEAPTQQQIEQDVTATNPSIESMESRG